MLLFRNIVAAWFVVFAATATATTDSSGKQAQALLERMSVAMKTLSYEGVFVFIHGKQMETMRIIHSNENGIEKERLLSLVGAPREILRNNDRLVCILPDSKSVVVEKSLPKNYLPTGLQRVTTELKRYYTFSVTGRERMTGRQAIMIDVHPKDPYRYGYHLWLDEQTGMLLKSDLVNEHGDPVEQVMFTQIDIKDHIPDAELEPTISSQGFKWFKEDNDVASSAQQKSQWMVMKLPAGYMQGMHKTHGLPTSRMPVEHLMFTDGISSVSVYIEEMNKSKPMMKGFSSIGAVNAYTTIMSDHYITVVGQVPRAAVKLIADSVRQQNGR
jgi:sigma-E factor negative regulatory protein RseB